MRAIGWLAVILGATAAPALAQHGGAVMGEDPSLPAHTVYRPSALALYGRGHPLPVVVWGNGGCALRGNSSEPFLSEVAAHGYLVIANGPIAAAPVRPPPPPPGTVTGTGGPPPGAEPRGPSSTTAGLRDGIDWAVAQNTTRGSPYFGKLNVTSVAAMGTSCGGLQAIELGPDPRVKTVATFSSGLLDQPRPGAAASRDDLARLHGPILYVVGGPTDGAVPHAAKDFAGIGNVPVVLAQDAAAGHGTPLIEPQGGGWAPVAVAWLDWQLKGHARERAMFVGTSCGLCRREGWSVQAKGW